MEPADSEDLNLFSPDPVGDWFWSPVVDRDCKYVNELAVLIRMAMVPSMGNNHDIGSHVEVDDVRMSLEVICCIIDMQGLVDQDLASPLDIRC